MFPTCRTVTSLQVKRTHEYIFFHPQGLSSNTLWNNWANECIKFIMLCSVHIFGPGGVQKEVTLLRTLLLSFLGSLPVSGKWKSKLSRKTISGQRCLASNSSPSITYTYIYERERERERESKGAISEKPVDTEFAIHFSYWMTEISTKHLL